MATFSFTTTAEQDRALAAKRVTDAPSAKDTAEYVAAVVRDTLLASVVAEYVEARVQLVADAYRAGTAEQRAAVDKDLGLA